MIRIIEFLKSHWRNYRFKLSGDKTKNKIAGKIILDAINKWVKQEIKHSPEWK